MIALDTNVITRLFITPADTGERKQQAVSSALLKSQRAFFVPVTVALELAWLLKSKYDHDARAIKSVLDHLMGLRNVTVEDAGAVDQAAQWHIKGLDFAVALHLAKSAACSELATFDDKRFAGRAQRLGLRPPVSPPPEA
jgi:predicted nucleic-acid-binding protein